MKYNVVFVHLLNDYSGSPKVLLASIEACADKNAKLYVGSSANGILSQSPVPTVRYWYRRAQHRLVTLVTYLCSQAILFFQLLSDRSIDKKAVIYINTALPFGAAVYGKLTSRKVMYHLHEISPAPALLGTFLLSVIKWTSSLNLYVSDSHLKAVPVCGVPSLRIYNSLDRTIVSASARARYSTRYAGCFNVYLIASLRHYKGIAEFLQLAMDVRAYGDIKFHLVLNESSDVIKKYLSTGSVPPNVTVHPPTNTVATHYARANLVLNLSRVNQCIETFGMTVLEAMAFGIPVIVPPKGGPAELVQDGVEGFYVDSSNRTLLMERTLLLYGDRLLCERMSRAGRDRAGRFTPEVFANSVRSSVGNVGAG